VPLADQTGRVAGALQQGGGRRRAGGQAVARVDRIAVRDIVRDAEAVAVLAGEQHRSGRRADRFGEALSEPHTLAGKAIHVGRMNLLVPVRAHCPLRVIVGVDEQHIRPFRGLLSAHGQVHAQQNGKQGETIWLTTLKPDGPGSFVEAISATGSRIIKFRV